MNNDGRIDIIKGDGRRASEEFSPDKLHRSVVAACLSSQSPIGEAEHIARRVCLNVITWCAEKGEVTSSDVRRTAATILEDFNAEAAYLYRTHQQII